MPLKAKMITFRSDLTTLDQKLIAKNAMESITEKKLFSLKYCENENPVSTQVTVKIMDIRWLLRGSDDFLNFVPILKSCKLDKLYQTDFMRSLTHEYWTHY